MTHTDPYGTRAMFFYDSNDGCLLMMHQVNPHVHLDAQKKIGQTIPFCELVDMNINGGLTINGGSPIAAWFMLVYKVYFMENPMTYENCWFIRFISWKLLFFNA